MNFFKSLMPLPLLLAACSPSGGTVAPPAPPLQGAKIGGAFALTDQTGRQVTDQAFAGKYRIMYFGYTFCPDVCPTTAQVIGQAMRKLDQSDPKLSARIVPVFVTVDPQRDTPAVLKQFVAAFHPRFVGLTGSVAAIERMKKLYGVAASKEAVQPNGSYLMGHSNAVYLMDPAGKPLALLPTDQGADAVAAEIERWAK